MSRWKALGCDSRGLFYFKHLVHGDKQGVVSLTDRGDTTTRQQECLIIVLLGRRVETLFTFLIQALERGFRRRVRSVGL